MADQQRQHAFEPDHTGRKCKFITYQNHRGISCGKGPKAKAHNGLRPAPPELEFPYPPCSICGKTTYHDGDGFRCDDCRAFWGNSGPGSWDDPSLPVCGSFFEPFNHADLAAVHEPIRHYAEYCILAADHPGLHRSDELHEWSDQQSVVKKT